LHWDDQAQRVHGIDRAMLLQHGRPAAEVAQRLNNDLGGRTVYCDGWAHDYAWLGVLFESAGLVPRFKLESVNRLLDDVRLARLDAERQQAFAALGIARHRASSDARALQWALGRLAA
jgi:DNA polymerase III epsilon subunit-like protein